MHLKLTKKMLEAMHVALDVAESSDGFDGGDFDGMDRQQFVYALTWVRQELAKLDAASQDHPPAGQSMPRIITAPGE